MINKNSIIYHLITDRFDNDDGTLENVRSDPEYRSRLLGRVGGTFKGIERRIPYLSELGVTHVMISPVERCRDDPGSYHGYDVTHPGEINPNFGTPEDLSSLVLKLEEAGIGTILDYVPLIICNQSELFKEKVQTPEGREWFFFRDLLSHPVYGEDMQRLAARQDCGESEYFHFFTGPHMPFFNLANQNVVNWQIERVVNSMRRYRFSDVRLDLGFYMPERVIRQFRDGIKTQVGESVSVIVENWPWPLEQFNGGECYGFCDGELNLKGTVLLNNYGSEPHLITLLRDHFYRTKGKSDSGYAFVTGIDNHDLPRFKGDIANQRLAAIMQFTLPNFTPIIFYGNESAMRDESPDPFAPGRGVMDFSSSSKLFDFYKQLVSFRRRNNFVAGRMNNYQYHDTNDGSNFENQLVTYNLVFPEGRSYHVVVNREAREKPANLGLLFRDPGVIPVDLLTGRELARVDEERHLIGSQDAYVLGNKVNSV